MRRFVALLAATNVMAALAWVVLAAPAPAATTGAVSDSPTGSVHVGSDAGPHRITGVQYGSDGAALLMDVYLPAAGATPAPVVLVVHGGGWAGGSRADTAPEAEALAAAGLAVLNVDYRLATPSAPGYPAQVSDLESALGWARAHAAALDIDPGRLGILGLSAGGNLALDLGVRGVAAAVVAWSAPTDLAAYETPARVCTSPACGPLSLPWAVYQELGCLPSACPSLYAEASPPAWARSHPAGLRSGPGGRGVKVVLWNSSSELVPQSQADTMATAARAAGASDVEEHVLPGSLHAGQYATTALAPTVAFLAAALSA